MSARPLYHLIDDYLETEANCARQIERRDHRNNTYIQMLEREVRQTRELAGAWKGLAITLACIALLLGVALWGKQ